MRTQTKTKLGGTDGKVQESARRYVFQRCIEEGKGGKHRFKPKPSNWDSDLDGDWEHQPGLAQADEKMEV